MKRRILHVVSWTVLLLSTLLFVSSTSGSTHETYTVYLPHISSSLSPIIPDTTNVLSETTTQYLTAVSPDGTTFTFTQATPELQDVAVGEVIVSEPTTLNPSGFLRKVTNISNSGGQLTFTTVQATLEEAIQQGEIHFQRRLLPEDVQEMTLFKGVTVVQRPQLIGGSFQYAIDDVVLYDEDNNPDTHNDQIVANGDVTLEVDFDFDLQVQAWHLEDLQFDATLIETSELTVESIIDESINVEIPLIKYRFTPFTVWVGSFPVTVEPQLTIYLGADGSVHAGMSTGVTQQATFTAGLRYANENWQTVSDLNNSFSYTAPTVTAEINVKASIKAKLDLIIMGVIGPYIKANLYLQLEVHPLTVPWWELYAGLDVPVGVKVKVLGHTLADYETDVLNYRHLLAQAKSVTSWAKAYQDNSSGNKLGANAIIQLTSDGNYLVASSTYPFEPPPYGNISVLKLSANGDVLWRYEYGTAATDTVVGVQELPDGGYILLGTVASNSKIWLLRLDSSGSIVWQKTYAYHAYNRAFSLTLTNEGGFIITGDTYDTPSDDRDAWVLKLNGDGTIAWQRLYGGTSSDYFSQIQNTTDGGYLAIGATGSFSPGVEYQPALWVVQLNANGDIGWQKTYSNVAGRYFRSNLEESLGNSLPAQIRPLAEGGYVLASGNQLLKIANDGTVIWGKRYVEANTVVVAEVPDGGFLLISQILTGEYPPSDDIWIAKVDSAGVIVWQKTVGESAARTYWVYSGKSDGDNHLVAGSRSYGPGDYDLLLLKLNSSGEIPGCGLCSTGNVTTEDVSFTTTASSASSTYTNIVPENSLISRQTVSTQVVTVCEE